MKLRKKYLKLITVICISALLMSCFGIQTVLGSDVVFELTSLGILNGIENVEERLDDKITRAELAQLIANLNGCGDLNADSLHYFDDISQSEYAAAIDSLCSMGIVSGTGDREFSPERFAGFSQACKMLVHSIGYEGAVKTKALNEYIAVAAKKGITKNVTIDGDTITMRAALTMIYNTLDIRLMPVTSFTNGQGSYTIATGELTLREKLLPSGKKRGVVTADSTTYLLQPIPALKSNQLEINGVIYNFIGDAPQGLVGMSVDIYLTELDTLEYVKACGINDKNTVSVFTAEAIETIENGVIKYTDAEGGTEKLSVNVLTKYVYNSRLYSGYPLNNLLNNKSLRIRAIDNDNDGTADVMFIEEYADCVVEKTVEKGSLVHFKQGYLYGTRKLLALDVTDDDVHIELLNADGEGIEFSQIKENSVLSIAASVNGEVIKVIASEKTMDGRIDEISGDGYAYIGGEAYKYHNARIEVGRTYTMYLNFLNEIVYAEETDVNKSYAYIYDTASGSGLGTAKVKMLIPGDISVKYNEEENADGGEVSKIPKLFCHNEAIVSYTLPEYIRLNGSRVSSKSVLGALSGQAVKFELNEKGEISRVDYLESASESTEKVYNSYEMTFGKTLGTAYGIQQKVTSSVCIPTNTGASDEDLMSYIELLNGVTYKIRAYEMNTDTQIVEMVVVEGEMRSGLTGSVTNKSDVGMVKRVYTSYDADNDTEVTRVSLLADGTEQEFIVSDAILNTISSVGRRDLIAYTLDNFDRLNGFVILQDAANYYDFLRNAFTENESCCAVVKDISYNYVSNARNRWVHSMDVGFSDSDTVVATYDFLKNSMPPIFLIENDEVKTASFEEVQIGDRVFIPASTSSVRALVVKR